MRAALLSAVTAALPGVPVPPAGWRQPALPGTGDLRPVPVQAASRGIWKDTRPKPLSS
ncbi:hypothetical protein ACMT4L_02000 [Deinococcus sp. A31D244]|uniref:Uncharacterized protein n=1 Tax=Deinococcus aquaticus TaxID=328692 RepID=A0ABY7UYU9_9DEIO|nr:hypothetical protein [Deinococcus aquaticus]WDA58098.1 hypothetical protein M8445_12180 [Deinococcus aquaticus]